MTPTPLAVSTSGSTPGDPVPIRLGTRASALATTQSGLVAKRLEELTGRPVELVHIKTEGDVKTGSLASLGGTGVFVTALREALLDGRCDVAVHSLKDLPTTPAPDLTFVTPERADPRDALCARDGLTLATLGHNARVGTGSPRRAAQIRAARPDLDVVDIRGNVGTRLNRALGPDADLDAVVLAYAGLARLDRTEVISEVLDVDVVAPAPGQGALAVEVRTADIVAGPSTGQEQGTAPRVPDLAEAIHLLDHRPTRLAVLAERSVLARLEAGCAAPVGAHATVSGTVLRLRAVVAAVDGSEQMSSAGEALLSQDVAPDVIDATARALGTSVAEDLLADGAERLAPLSATVPEKA
ncbi:hydroxymethylbilane synthase [Promicromonospora iranensis]|uniref:Hydroxymethylbilane synthase n=1 Tax=Promicromonospora iranensis TaxID=1105144 RepID=A0ABU2CP30_9MICO|nr:hydroxymethylbilane synthase [Promicromonospora iranensis]MDR7383099.1 hydroxymethylbilane synthase [Promicromonospora iranensis]